MGSLVISESNPPLVACGVNALGPTGSQRGVNKSINLTVLQALATIAGNERVTDDF